MFGCCSHASITDLWGSSQTSDGWASSCRRFRLHRLAVSLLCGANGSVRITTRGQSSQQITGSLSLKPAGNPLIWVFIPTHLVFFHRRKSRRFSWKLLVRKQNSFIPQNPNYTLIVMPNNTGSPPGGAVTITAHSMQEYTACVRAGRTFNTQINLLLVCFISPARWWSVTTALGLIF